MGPGPRAALLLPLLVAALSGCTVYNDLQRFLNRAQGRPEFADMEKLNEEVVFAVNDPPTPPAPGRVTALNFTVAPGATRLHIDITVSFDGPLPAPLPARGRVNVSIAPPSAAPTNLAFTETSAQAYDRDGPAQGTWGVRVETVGQGRVRIVAVSREPVAA